MLSFSPELGTYVGADSDIRFISAQACIAAEGQKGFASPEIKRELKSTPPGTFLLFEEEFAVARSEAVSAHFAEIEGLEQTREESAHGVRFGQLVFTSLEGSQRAELVAVKPFDMPADAAYESGAMMAVNALEPHRNSPLSYTPLGFFRFGDGATGLVTRYDIAVKTQDTIFWNPEQPPTEQETTRALGYGALALGMLHYYGFTHGDAQVKNVATDSKGVRYPDLEYARRHGNSHSPDPFATRSHVEDDLRKYLSSLGSRTEGYAVDEAMIAEAFVPTYTRLAAAPGTTIPEEARFSRLEVIELAY